jgi:hypothetical protein
MSEHPIDPLIDALWRHPEFVAACDDNRLSIDQIREIVTRITIEHLPSLLLPAGSASAMRSSSPPSQEPANEALLEESTGGHFARVLRKVLAAIARIDAVLAKGDEASRDELDGTKRELLEAAIAMTLGLKGSEEYIVLEAQESAPELFNPRKA